MFGIFYLMFDGIMSTINGIDRDYQNSKNRIEAKNLGDLTYFGSRGGEYLVENGRQVMRTIRSYDNHEIIKDMRTGKVYYDLTKIKKERKIEELKKEGKTIYYPEKEEKKQVHYWHNESGFNGIVIDIDTRKYLAELHINEFTFYMDLESGYLLRRTDSDLNYLYKKEGIYDNCALTPEQIISYFNKRQDLLRQYPMFSERQWKQAVFYLSNYSGHLYMNKKGIFIKQKIKKEYYDKAVKRHEEMKNRYDNKIIWEKQNGYYQPNSIINQEYKKAMDLINPDQFKEKPATTNIGFALYDINAWGEEEVTL